MISGKWIGSNHGSYEKFYLNHMSRIILKKDDPEWSVSRIKSRIIFWFGYSQPWFVHTFISSVLSSFYANLRKDLRGVRIVQLKSVSIFYSSLVPLLCLHLFHLYSLLPPFFEGTPLDKVEKCQKQEGIMHKQVNMCCYEHWWNSNDWHYFPSPSIALKTACSKLHPWSVFLNKDRKGRVQTK